MTLFSKDYKPEKVAGASLEHGNYVEYKSEVNEQLLIDEYFQNTRPYLRDKMNDLTTSGKCEIQLIMKITFVSSKYSGEKRLVYCKSNNKEIMIGFDID